MEIKENAASWFEIPVTDMERAIKFYEAVMGYSLQRHQMGPLDMAWFPWPEGHNAAGGAPGSLCCNPEFYQPSSQGTLVYLGSPSGNLANELARVESAGGKILVPKTEIGGGHGFMAVFLDSEGNRVAFHSLA